MKVSIKDAKKYIEQLNLNYIVEAMTSADYVLPRWTLEDAHYCCQLYKNFLLLQKIHFTENLVPTRQIDEFWHNHILHTQEYTNDCLQIFGVYLHHNPASPNGNGQELADNYLKTKEYYYKEFNQPLTLIK